ncbi:putative type 11 methyltransferase protein [Phaeoacremonium minimum UCRPA7]|uniref:phosphoethanolamine N-methyltransferase n=1 Tax=Phaeoacremonium minimum (strain UCR-PA7) TaxID=1286976 RepID=R8BGF8_PHAM7|nr:putative type 11 methyltransferase protein [Phaeoacremonium minimum UCRPA7]EON98406.1 putative type 11 methyltransferase protein [Phaeoacremonium minimum UCRPA7]
MQEQNPEHYSSLAARYEKAFSQNPALSKFLQTILTHLPETSAVLDVGCGTGRPVAVTLAQAGHHVTGVDFSPEMINLISKTVPDGSFELADMRHYEPPDGMQFHAVLNILSLFVLDREEIEALVQRQVSWLRPGGLLCVATIAAEDIPKEKMNGGFGEDGLCARKIPWRFLGEDVTISVLFTRNGWKKTLADAGLEIVHTQGELFVPPKESDTDEEPELFIIAKKLG